VPLGWDRHGVGSLGALSAHPAPPPGADLTGITARHHRRDVIPCGNDLMTDDHDRLTRPTHATDSRDRRDSPRPGTL